MRLQSGGLTVAIFLANALPQAALSAAIEYPITIPLECVELAQREGHPLVIESKVQALRARYKLSRLDRQDPLVRQCREAVARVQAGVRQ